MSTIIFNYIIEIAETRHLPHGPMLIDRMLITFAFFSGVMGLFCHALVFDAYLNLHCPRTKRPNFGFYFIVVFLVGGLISVAVILGPEYYRLLWPQDPAYIHEPVVVLHPQLRPYILFYFGGPFCGIMVCGFFTNLIVACVSTWWKRLAPYSTFISFFALAWVIVVNCFFWAWCPIHLANLARAAVELKLATGAVGPQVIDLWYGPFKFTFHQLESIGRFKAFTRAALDAGFSIHDFHHIPKPLLTCALYNLDAVYDELLACLNTIHTNNWAGTMISELKTLNPAVTMTSTRAELWALAPPGPSYYGYKLWTFEHYLHVFSRPPITIPVKTW